MARRKRYGNDPIVKKKYNEEPVSTEIVEGKKYNKTELTAIADQLLRDDSHSEMCRKCGELGTKTGKTQLQQFRSMKDKQGNELAVEFDEIECPDGHVWYLGEGKERGIGGDNPILFEEHFHSRRRREIYTSVGTPDPSIVAGIYNRTHPQGRKVNSADQRKKNGASYYR